MSDHDREMNEMNYDDDREIEEMLAFYYECSKRSAVDALADHEAREPARQYRDGLVPRFFERFQTALKRALSRIAPRTQRATSASFR